MNRCVLRRNGDGRTGFSLMEVNLAILIVSIGLLTLFSLFPLGLREGDMSIIDTQEGMFADQILNGMAANAQDIEWDAWTNRNVFMDRVESNIYPLATSYGWQQLTNPIPFPTGGVARVLRYRVSLVDPINASTNSWVQSARRRVIVEVKSGPYGMFDHPQVYATDLTYMGM